MNHKQEECYPKTLAEPRQNQKKDSQQNIKRDRTIHGEDPNHELPGIELYTHLRLAGQDQNS